MRLARRPRRSLRSPSALHVSAGIERGRRYRAVAKEALRYADAADRQRFETLGLEAAADDELRRSAADVDHQPRARGRRKLVRDAEVREASFLVAADDVDGKAQRALGESDEFLGVPGDAKGVGGDDAHRGGMQSRQPLAEAREAGEGAFIAVCVRRPLSSMPAPKRSVSRHVSSW
jgi:hypothetical protein